ncbi:hypothetical protein KOR42_42410 [Thalassoglobus neptunius]|uniref:DUF456 domain-containing protein n=1 Tax=Thalassoglobus neptunius TaxID=1938619 RepID=A0A5C5W8V7_9PLAN|nr:DUF456 domain-containing protein [Thalassoglobus neptunius]TWT47044.1 hypothetical protein KOR42_42410 [Thalassoglobus neptunius]
MVYVYINVLFIANFCSWGTTLLMGPGNWLILFFSALYAYLLPLDLQPRVSWTVVGVLAVLAILGEILESAAGAAGVTRLGGTRRGALYSIVGAFIGTFTGAMMGVPIPFIGSVVAAVFGGALGAFGGAYLGERERLHGDRFAIGKGAFWGRLLGTFGKLIVGAIMLALVTVDSIF